MQSLVQKKTLLKLVMSSESLIESGLAEVSTEYFEEDKELVMDRLIVHLVGLRTPGYSLEVGRANRQGAQGRLMVKQNPRGSTRGKWEVHQGLACRVDVQIATEAEGQNVKHNSRVKESMRFSCWFLWINSPPGGVTL